MKRLSLRQPRLPLAPRLFILALAPVLFLVALVCADRIWGPFSHEWWALVIGIFALPVLLHYLWLWRLCNDPFQTLANFVHALHQGDYTQRVVAYPTGDALGTLQKEINHLADVLQNNRFAVVESSRRFQYLVDQLEAGVVAFDENQQLCWANVHFCRLYGKSCEELIDRSVEDLGLEALWTSGNGRTLWLDLPEKSSRFLLQTKAFREDGRPQRLFLLTDLKHPLREEERTAWRRLIRVLGHELNNSLTPITSLAQSLKQRVQRADLPEEWRESSGEALDIIIDRARRLNRFVEEYAKLAKLPEPQREETEVGSLVNRACRLIQHPGLHVEPGASCRIRVDPGQIEQLLINVLRNAIQACPADSGQVRVHWKQESSDVVIRIDDNGPGIENPENLFVPFFSTKPGGSGIGLVLCRQIAEANGGTVHLQNRPEGGARATIALPLDQETAQYWDTTVSN